MDEFIKEKGKILRIDDPIGLFMNILSFSSGNSFEQRSEKWQSLNTLMIINNHRRIDNLENQVEMEQARVKYLEDTSERLNKKVIGLEKSIYKVKSDLGHQRKSIMTILSLVKLVSNHQSNKNDKLGNIKKFVIFAAQNAIVYGLVQLLMRITCLDWMIDNLLNILRLGNILSRKSIEKSKFLTKLALSATLFIILRDKIKLLLEKLRNTIGILI